MEDIKLKVPSEKFLFIILAFISVMTYLLLIVSLIGILYLIFAAIFSTIVKGILIGSIKGNAIKLSHTQLGDIYNEYTQLAKQMGFDEVPDIYLIQSGGDLNAFATRFIGRDFVVVYADVLEMAYEEGLDEVKFILAHELGHLKANHLRRRWLIGVGLMIPLLGHAYLRACEYTADRYGAYYSPNGAQKGLLLLAAGKKLYKNVDIDQYIKQTSEEKGFWVSVAELFSTHPHLTKRVEHCRDFVRYISPRTENQAISHTSSV